MISPSRVSMITATVVPDRTVVYNPDTGDLISSDYVRRQWVGGNDSGFRYGDVRYWLNTEARSSFSKGNLESQVHPSHQIRTGFETKWDEIFRHRIGMPTLPNLEYFTYKPFAAALYIQDKIEYSFMILKVGLRLDYFDPRASEYPDPSQVLEVYTTPAGRRTTRQPTRSRSIRMCKSVPGSELHIRFPTRRPSILRTDISSRSRASTISTGVTP